MESNPKKAPAPKTEKTTRKRTAPASTTDAIKTSVEVVTDPHKRLTASRLREMLATRKAEMAQAIADADAADFAAEQAAKDHTTQRTAPRPEARAELAAIPQEIRRLAWTLTALEREWDAVSDDLKMRVQHGAHAGGVGNQLHALYSIDASGCLKNLAVIDLFLRLVRSWPETDAATDLIDPLLWEVAELDAAEVEHARRLAEANAEHDRLVAEARARAELAIMADPAVAESNLRIFKLIHPVV